MIDKNAILGYIVLMIVGVVTASSGIYITKLNKASAIKEYETMQEEKTKDALRRSSKGDIIVSDNTLWVVNNIITKNRNVDFYLQKISVDRKGHLINSPDESYWQLGWYAECWECHSYKGVLGK